MLGEKKDARLSCPDSEPVKKSVYDASFHRIDKPKALSLLLHTADISHPSKPWALHSRWTKALMEEFFQQVGTLKDVTLAFVSSSKLSHQ